MLEPKPNPPKFLSLINDVYEKEEKEQEAKPQKTDYRHNPSSATMVTSDGKVVGSCLRALFYKAIDEPVTNKKQLTTKLQGGFGNGIHDFLTERLKKSDKIKLVSEAPGKIIVEPLTKEISFRLDGLVTYIGELGCLEIKTMNSFKLQNMVKTTGPRKSDILQVLCYFGTNEDIKWASLVYVARDTAFRAEYHIYKDPVTKEFVIKGVTPSKPEEPIRDLSFASIVARWKVLEDHVDRKELPKRDFKVVLKTDGTITDKRVKNGVEYKSDFACLYCSYLTKCWSQPDATKESYQIGRTNE